MPLTRSPAEIFAAHADAIKADIRKCLPGTVVAVHASRQTVDVQLAVNGVLFDELGTAVSVPAPSLADVPLGVMRGGGFLVWVPVAVGDSVLVIFSDLSCDTWRGQAATASGDAVDPGFVGMHSHDSPFAIPMVAPDSRALTSTPTDKVVIGKDGADEQILIGVSDILLGRAATDFVALSTKVSIELAKIQNALTHIVVTGTASGGIVTGTGTAVYTPGSVAATLVRAQ